MAAQLPQLLCVTKGCEEEAECYCTVCKQLLCGTHNQMHSEFMKNIMQTTHKVLTVDEYKEAEREERSKYCERHGKSPIILACENCYEPMCMECVDDRVILTDCETDQQEKHITQSVELVARKIQDELSELLSELKANEMMNGDGMKRRRERFDKDMEDNRDDLEKLAAKVKELHKQIDDFARETRDALVAHMTVRKEEIDAWEAEFSRYQESCREIHGRTAKFFERHSAIIVKEKRRIEDAIGPVLNVKFQSEQQKGLSLAITDGDLVIPIILEEKFQLPKHLKFNESRSPARDSIYSVQYIQKGNLICSGNNHTITGLNIADEIISGQSGRIYSLCEHGSSLYILQYHNLGLKRHFYVHLVNLKNLKIQPTVIKTAGSANQAQLAVSEKYIIFPIRQHGFGVFSTTDHSHIFDIKHQFFKNWPLGITFLKENIIVSDNNSNRVSLMTVSATPEIRWTTEIVEPSAVRVVDHYQSIFVASFRRKIHLLSFQGEKLANYELPECRDIRDISIYNTQLAVADSTTEIKVYEMKTE